METPACTGLSCNGVTQPPPAPQDVPSGLADTRDASAVPPPARAKLACGTGSCLPDDPTACVDYVPPPDPDLGDAGVSADASTGETGGDAGVGGDAGGDPDIDGSFNQPSRPSSGAPQFACQLSAPSTGVERTCGVAGSQQAEQACTSSIDCAPGLGCVGTQGSGRCLPFCCGVDSDDTCAAGFYCAERKLRTEGAADGPLVPVCDRAENCSLGEAKDCVGERCVCGPTAACMLVRPGGTTACVALSERPGQAGQACPCDRGYHCSQAISTCVKTCDLDEEDSDTCGAGVCQATPVLPAGWGICVGAAPDQMTQP